MNTHFGLHTPDASMERLLGLLPVGAHGYGATVPEVTFNLAGMNQMLKDRRLRYQLHDTLLGFNKEPTTCCCPPWTPWAPKPEYYGAGCASTPDRCDQRGIRGIVTVENLT